MGDVVHMGGRKIFTLEEVQEILPVLRRVTEEAVREVERRQAQILSAGEGSDLADRTREQIEEIYRTWIGKVERLGGWPKGPWLVDFDNGIDFYCWQWPEDELEWAHPYETGIAGRYPLAEQ
jgi:hypothetical protein